MTGSQKVRDVATTLEPRESLKLAIRSVSYGTCAKRTSVNVAYFRLSRS
jgi:hypothetical protein